MIKDVTVESPEVIHNVIQVLRQQIKLSAFLESCIKPRGTGRKCTSLPVLLLMSGETACSPSRADAAVV